MAQAPESVPMRASTSASGRVESDTSAHERMAHWWACAMPFTLARGSPPLKHVTISHLPASPLISPARTPQLSPSPSLTPTSSRSASGSRVFDDMPEALRWNATANRTVKCHLCVVAGKLVSVYEAEWTAADGPGHLRWRLLKTVYAPFEPRKVSTVSAMLPPVAAPSSTQLLTPAPVSEDWLPTDAVFIAMGSKAVLVRLEDLHVFELASPVFDEAEATSSPTRARSRSTLSASGATGTVALTTAAASARSFLKTASARIASALEGDASVPVGHRGVRADYARARPISVSIPVDRESADDATTPTVARSLSTSSGSPGTSTSHKWLACSTIEIQTRAQPPPLHLLTRGNVSWLTSAPLALEHTPSISTGLGADFKGDTVALDPLASVQWQVAPKSLDRVDAIPIPGSRGRTELLVLIATTRTALEVRELAVREDCHGELALVPASRDDLQACGRPVDDDLELGDRALFDAARDSGALAMSAAAGLFGWTQNASDYELRLVSPF